MTDPRFFSRSAPLSIEAVVEITGATLMSEAETYPKIKDVRPIEAAGLGDLTFVENRKYVDLVAKTQASACFISSVLVDRAAPDLILLITDHPRRCFAKIANIMYPALLIRENTALSVGIQGVVTSKLVNTNTATIV